MSDTQATKPAISRRTVAKGMAWSVPAVAIARTAPALAASGAPPTGAVHAACKLPGNSCGDVFVKGYVFELTISNDSGKTIFLYNQAGFEIEITEDNPDLDLFFQAAVDSTTGDVLTFPLELQDGESITILLNAGENGNSAEQAIAGTISFPWGHTPTPPDPDNHPDLVLEFDFEDTPPLQGAQCSFSLPPNCGE
jgi:hypothetical protein